MSEEDEGMRASALIVVWLLCAAVGWGCIALVAKAVMVLWRVVSHG